MVKRHFFEEGIDLARVPLIRFTDILFVRHEEVFCLKNKNKEPLHEHLRLDQAGCRPIASAHCQHPHHNSAQPGRNPHGNHLSHSEYDSQNPNPWAGHFRYHARLYQLDPLTSQTCKTNEQNELKGDE